MLPGGVTPVVQLVAMIRNASPTAAAGLLMAAPADRLPHVIAAMSPADLARLLQAARPDLDRRLAQALPADQLIWVVHAVPVERAVALLSTLPADRLNPLIGALPDQITSALFAALPDERRAGMATVMEPGQAQAGLAQQYVREVADALIRMNISVMIPEGGTGNILLAQTLGWRMVVAPLHDDDGTVSTRDAESAAYQLGAKGGLAVTGQSPSEGAIRYCRASGSHGRPAVNAVLWTDNRHDGELARSLVSLLGH